MIKTLRATAKRNPEKERERLKITQEFSARSKINNEIKL